jgi:tryptophanyl-tRNA synthetase
MSIITDSASVDAPKDPAASSIIALYKLCADAAAVSLMEDQFRAGGLGYGEFKKRLFEALWEKFAPFRAKRAALAADPSTLDAILADGAARARAVALPTMDRVRKAVGLR